MTAPSLLSFGGYGAVGLPSTASTSFMQALGSGVFQGSVSTNVNRLSYVGTSGTFSKLGGSVGSNSRSSTTTLDFFKNGTQQTMQTSVGAGVTGLIQDTTNTVPISIGDDFGCNFTNGTGVGTCGFREATVIFTPTSGTSQFLCCFNASAPAASTGAFVSFSGTLSSNATETNRQGILVVGGTAHHLQCYVPTNTRNSTSTVKLRQNALNTTNLSVSIAAGATGLITDLTNSDALSANDKIDAGFTLVAGTGVLNTLMVGIWLDSAVDTQSNILAQNGGSPIALLTGTKFVSAISLLTVGGTEATLQARFGLAGTVDLLSLIVTANLATVTSTFISRVNTANGGQSISIGAGATGTFQDLSGSDAVAASDLICYQLSGHDNTVNIGSLANRLTTASTGNIYSVSMAESASAASSESDNAVLPSTIADSGSAADSLSNIAMLPSAVADSASAADTQSNVAVFPRTVTEAASAADAPAGAVIFPSTVAESVTALDVESTKAVLPSAVAESAPVTDQEQTNGPQAVTVAETITLTDQFSAQLVGGATVTEAAAAASIQSMALTLNLGITEGASAADSLAAQLTAFLAMAEAASAQDLTAAQLVAQIAIQEAMDLEDAITQAGAVLFASKCNILSGAPRMRVLSGAPRVRILHGGCC